MSRDFNAILGFQTAPEPLATGKEIWYEVFVWCFFSSVTLYSMAAGVAFLTLRKHKFGRYLIQITRLIRFKNVVYFQYRFYSLMILFMGFVLPLTLGVLSSASVAFVYKTSSFGMETSHAIMWGAGQTVIHAFFGVTRILATL